MRGAEREDRALLLSTKNPVKVRAGQIGARVRWGAPRLVRIDDLSPEQARLVRALVEAARAERNESASEAAA